MPRADIHLTRRARRIVRTAREITRDVGSRAVTSDALLLAIGADADGVGGMVLRTLGVGPDRLRGEVGRVAGPARETRGQLHTCLAAAQAEARAWSHPLVCSEHLLLGILRARVEPAASTLDRLGVMLSEAQRVTARLLGASAAERASIRLAAGGARLVGDRIVASVREGIATRRLRPGDRLPAVRRLAGELGVAPGTVARAYATLARLGLVVADGVHGTMIGSGGQPDVAVDDLAVAELLRPIVVTAFHMGATADQLHHALSIAMEGIFGSRAQPPAADRP